MFHLSCTDPTLFDFSRSSVTLQRALHCLIRTCSHQLATHHLCLWTEGTSPSASRSVQVSHHLLSTASCFTSSQVQVSRCSHHSPCVSRATELVNSITSWISISVDLDPLPASLHLILPHKSSLAPFQIPLPSPSLFPSSCSLVPPLPMKTHMRFWAYTMVCHMTFLSPQTQTSHTCHQLTQSCIVRLASSFIISTILLLSFLAHQSPLLVFNPEPVQQGFKIIHEPFKCAVNPFTCFQPHCSPQTFKPSNHPSSDTLQHIFHQCHHRHCADVEEFNWTTVVLSVSGIGAPIISLFSLLFSDHLLCH